MKRLPHKIRFAKEQIFADFLTSQGFDFIYQPTAFNANGVQYRPDFYVIKEQTYYEVVGSRQAFHQNQNKINYLLNIYPFIRLKIINPDGSEYLIPKSRRKLKISGYKLVPYTIRYSHHNPNPPSDKELINTFVAYQEKLRFNTELLSRHTKEIDPLKRGISAITLYKITRGYLPKGGSRVEAVLRVLVTEFKQKYYLGDGKKEKEGVNIIA